MAVTARRLGATFAFILRSARAGAASAELGFNFSASAAGVAQEICAIHMLATPIATALLAIGCAVVRYPLCRRRKSRGDEDDQREPVVILRDPTEPPRFALRWPRELPEKGTHSGNALHCFARAPIALVLTVRLSLTRWQDDEATA